MHTVIAENDESQWEDETGVLYHFPKRYEKYLISGTEVIYYKGKLKNTKFRDKRLSDDPHYFAKAVIGNIYSDKESSKGDLFATIVGYSSFEIPIFAKTDGEYIEVIPDSQKTNYWRNGVRPINTSIYEKILLSLKPDQISEPLSGYEIPEEVNDTNYELQSGTEGLSNKRYVTTYERNPKYRKQAIAIHGTSCVACGFNFGEFYGDYAEGYIHIHHITPVSQLEAPKNIDPEKDLVPLCANCHSVVHRKKATTLSIDEIIKLIEKMSNKLK
jgi:putative restriction endonuclease